MFDFAFAHGLSRGFPARRDLGQSVFPFQAAHKSFLPFVVMAVGYHFAFHGHAVRQNVNVRMFRVRMFSHNVLAVFEPHALKVFLRHISPLTVRKAFAWGDAQADVANSFCQIGTQGSDFTKLTRQGTCVASSHVRIQKLALFLTQIVFQRTPETRTFNHLGYHGSPPTFPGATPALFPVADQTKKVIRKRALHAPPAQAG